MLDSRWPVARDSPSLARDSSRGQVKKPKQVISSHLPAILCDCSYKTDIFSLSLMDFLRLSRSWSIKESVSNRQLTLSEIRSAIFWMGQDISDEILGD